MKALLSMNYAKKSSLLPGVVQRTSRTYDFIMSQMQLQRFNGTTKLWVAHRQVGGRAPALGTSAPRVDSK